jgi:hypothetical protein
MIGSQDYLNLRGQYKYNTKIGSQGIGFRTKHNLYLSSEECCKYYSVQTTCLQNQVSGEEKQPRRVVKAKAP